MLLLAFNCLREMLKPSLKNTLYRWRVRAGFIGLIAAILLAKPNLFSLLLGAGICLIGLLLRAWASGHLKKEKELIMSGPYRYTRNPLYLANGIIGISVVIASRSWWLLGIFAAYFILFYPLVMKIEEEKLNAFFPEDFADYRKKVPLFFPSLKKPPIPYKNRFSIKLYRKNREWRALIGGIIFWLILALKATVL